VTNRPPASVTAPPENDAEATTICAFATGALFESSAMPLTVPCRCIVKFWLVFPPAVTVRPVKLCETKPMAED
jgi:hypothetical protein